MSTTVLESGTRGRGYGTAVFVDVDDLEDWLAGGVTVGEIADWLGCTQRTVRNIAHRHGVALARARREAHRLANPAGPKVRKRKFPQLYEPGWLARRRAAGDTYASIGAEVGCGEAAVRHAARQLAIPGLPPRRRFPRLEDRQWLYQQHIVRQRTITEIAVTVGACPATVATALTRNGVPRRRAGGRPRPIAPPPGRLRRDWARHRRTSVLAERYGVGRATVQIWLAQCGIFTTAPRIDVAALTEAVAATATLTQLATNVGMDRPTVRVELLRHCLPRPGEQLRAQRAATTATTGSLHP